jgi:potassium-transporting ATPase KdpC subunit
MMTQLRPAVVLFLIMTLLVGVVYPLVVTGISSIALATQANGSLVQDGDTVVGSALIGQISYSLDDNGQIANLPAIERYFWGRPSAINYGVGGGLVGSSGSNLGPIDTRLADSIAAREAAFRAANTVPAETAIPAEMLTASASGLDPHISPEAARLQIARVAAARGLTAEQVTALVDQFTEGAQLGVLGQPRVNVLLLNRALDADG